MIKLIICATALILCAGRWAGAADEIYVKMQGDAPAILSNGGEFTTMKDDCYPFIGYDATQTLMQLKFGTFSFWTRKNNGEIVPEAGTAAAAAKYRADVAKFRAVGERQAVLGGPRPITGVTGIPDRAALTTQASDQSAESLRATFRQELWKALAARGGDHSVDSFPVDAASPAWQNSGVRVKAGQHVLVQASEKDTWDLGQGKTNAKGYPFVPPNAGTAVYHTGTVTDDWHWGAMICAIGDSRNEIDNSQHQVEVGLKRGFTVDNDGYIYFICNDNRELPNGASGYDDNSGIVHVKVTVTDAEAERGATAAASPAESSPNDEAPETGLRRPQNSLRAVIRQELWKALAVKGGDHDANAFPVDSFSSEWQNSGVRVRAGQHVLVQAAEGDTWDIGWGPRDAKGYNYQEDPNAGTPTFHTGTPNDDWHWGALICAVGDGRSEIGDPRRQLEIGLKREFTADEGGYLYFVCNDNPGLPNGGNEYIDNSGIIHVKISVTDAKTEGGPSPAPPAN